MTIFFYLKGRKASPQPAPKRPVEYLLTSKRVDEWSDPEHFFLFLYSCTILSEYFHLSAAKQSKLHLLKTTSLGLYWQLSNYYRHYGPFVTDTKLFIFARRVANIIVLIESQIYKGNLNLRPTSLELQTFVGPYL